MRTLDRYIGRSFLEPFLVATAAVLGLYIVADAFYKIDDYLRNASGVTEAICRMASIYFLRIPTFLIPVLPISSLIGATYAMSQLSGNNELVAMRACGISFWRILAPVYALAAIVAIGGAANREELVPLVESAATPDMLSWIGQGERTEMVTLYLDKEDSLFTLRYNRATRSVQSMTITMKKTGEHVVARKGATPLRTGRGWLLKGARVGSRQETPELEWKTALRVRDVELAVLDPDVSPVKMLRRLIKQNPDVHSYRLAYHTRLAYPFTGIVLVGLGLPFVMGSERIQRSRMLGVGVSVFICMVFYAVQFIGADLGQNGRLPPEIAAWLPHVLFGALGLYLLETAHN